MDRLRFASHLAPALEPTYRGIAKLVGERLAIDTELVVADDYERCERDLDEVCFVCSLPYVELADAGRAPGVPVVAPVVRGERYGGRPIYYSDVVVRAESDIRSFGDLRGRVFAYNEPRSHSGYGVVLYHLARTGETHGFFGEVVEAGFDHEAIRMVEEGVAEAAAIDSHLLDVLRRERPELGSRLRVIEVLGPSTIQPVVLSNRVPESLRERIRSSFLSLQEDEVGRTVLDGGMIDRFAPVADSDYDDVRAMTSAARDAGLTTLR